MKRALKELLASAPVKKKGEWKQVMVVSNGIYNGFWGHNGYNNIILLGRDGKDSEWYKICDEADIVNISMNLKSYFEIDIPNCYGVPVITFKKTVFIDYDGISRVCGEEG